MREKRWESPLDIVFIASEATPFIKTGGLADVVGSLPNVLRSMGHHPTIVLPKYAGIDIERYKLEPFLDQLGVWMGDGLEWCAVDRTIHHGVPVYFIESNKYFDRWGLYHDADYIDYLDNPRRFGFFSRAALQLCRDVGLQADIIHTHDWMTAIAPAYLKIWHWDDPIIGRTASVLTIHNIAYQGVYPGEHFDYLGLQWGNFSSDKFEDHGAVNLLKGGIQYADMVNTVSPKYADETRTPAGGLGLAPFLNDRRDDYVGVLNGVDYEIWDPSVDDLIPAKFSIDNMVGKKVCKQELQKRMFLVEDPDVPLLGVISRFAHQKGLDLLAGAIRSILDNMNIQFVILGSGEPELEHQFVELTNDYPGRVGSIIGYNDELSHWIEAGADFYVMPSRFEPCGMNQIYSLRYGTLPIVRATGGLDDTVFQYNETTGEGTGFKFWEPSVHSIYYAVGWAVSTYYDRPDHIQRMIRTAMKQDFSWNRSAEEYVKIYQRAMANQRRL